jgi:prepilin-type N-terminal cleavage/methylation domain-containing protein
MRFSRDSGFTMIELLVVLAVVTIIGLIGWQVMEGWRERNAIRMVSQEIKHLFEKYRQKAIDKGINYGLIFSDDGLYVFEDNGGNGSDRFLKMNNFAVDTGEFSDLVNPGAGGPRRSLRRASKGTDEFRLFTGGDPYGHLLVMTMNTLELDTGRSLTAYSPAGTDITGRAFTSFGSSPGSPFDSGTLALFFSPNGCVYLKDPTVAASPLTIEQFLLGGGPQAFVVVRISWDDENSYNSEVPYYYEVAINRYGAATYVRWQTYDGGSTWNAQIE